MDAVLQAELDKIREEYQDERESVSGRPASDNVGSAQATDRESGESDGTLSNALGQDGRTSETHARSDSRDGQQHPKTATDHRRSGQNARRETAKPRGINAKPSRQEKVERKKAEDAAKPRSHHKKKIPVAMPPLPTHDTVEDVKDVAQKAFPRLKRSNRAFSEGEAKAKRDDLIEAIMAESQWIDEFIGITNQKQIRHPDIWIMDEEEASAFADFWLKRAQKSAGAASLVNASIDAHENGQVFALLIPRFTNTFIFYRQNGIGFSEHGHRRKGSTGSSNA